jgi:hypothetical protein
MEYLERENPVALLPVNEHYRATYKIMAIFPDCQMPYIGVKAEAYYNLKTNQHLRID